MFYQKKSWNEVRRHFVYYLGKEYYFQTLSVHSIRFQIYLPWLCYERCLDGYSKSLWRVLFVRFYCSLTDDDDSCIRVGLNILVLLTLRHLNLLFIVYIRKFWHNIVILMFRILLFRIHCIETYNELVAHLGFCLIGEGAGMYLSGGHCLRYNHLL